MTNELNKIKESSVPSTYSGYKVYTRKDSKGDYLQAFSSSLNSDLGERFRNLSELKTFIDKLI